MPNEKLFSTSGVAQAIYTRLTNLETQYSSITASVGAPLASPHFTGSPTFGDNNFAITIASSNPKIQFDANDYLQYDRTGNKLHLYIGGVDVASIDGGGNLTIKGILTSAGGSTGGGTTPTNPTTAKLFMRGTVPGAMGQSSAVIYTYDEAKRCLMRDQSARVIYALDAPFDDGSNWNSTRDGSVLTDYERGLKSANPNGISKPTVKMDLDGTIDLDVCVSLGMTNIHIPLPTEVTPNRSNTTFQVRFYQRANGVTLSTSGHNGLTGWVAEPGDTTGTLYRFQTNDTSLSGEIVIPIDSASIPSRKLRRPVIVPHPTASDQAVMPEPVGNPEEIGRLKKAGMYFRDLDWMATNVSSINGDSVSSMRLLTEEATDYRQSSDGKPRITLSEAVAIANEAGVGLWHCEDHRARPLWPQHIATLAQVNGPTFVEYSNEVWNSAFVQNGENLVMGLRLGLAGEVYKSSLSVARNDILWPNKHQISQTYVNHSLNDLVVVNISGAGTLVLRILRSTPANTLLPIVVTVDSNGGITKARSAGDIAIRGGTSLYITLQDAPEGTLLTDAAYFKPADGTTISQCPFSVEINPADCNKAGWNHRGWRQKQLHDMLVTARASAGKSPPICVMNVAPGNVSNFNPTGSSTETAYMNNFDDFWMTEKWVTQSCYMGLSGLSSSATMWGYKSTTPAAGWLNTDRQAIYKPSSEMSFDNAVNAGVEKMLSDQARHVWINGVISRTVSAQQSLKAFLQKRMSDYNAANPSSPISVTPLLGFYEDGIQLDNSSGWPDEEADPWSATAQYTAGYLLPASSTDTTTSWCYVGNILCRAKVDNINVSPLEHPDTWEQLPYGSGHGFSIIRQSGALMNNFMSHPNCYKLIDEMRQAQENYGNTYLGGRMLTNQYTVAREYYAKGAISFGQRFKTFEDKATSPAWAASADWKTAWDALP